MRDFEFEKSYRTLLVPEMISYLTLLHEYRGKQESMLRGNPEVLTRLVELAKIQSTDASNKIEGIYTSDERLKLLVREKTMPRTRDEKEIAGYRDVLATIHESYPYIPVKPSVILQLHRDLYKFSGKSIGGSYKNSDNSIQETDADGNKRIRFMPVHAWETPEAVERLCAAYDEALKSPEIDPLLLIPVFVLDFLCIHPFNDGNGRMSRLLTLLLLYRSGYLVGKYISIERLIADSKETYYEALEESSVGWHEGSGDYAPFARYLLGVVAAAYRELEQRVSAMESGESKIDRVRAAVRDTLGAVTKAELLKRCPGVSQVTVQRALAEMLKNGEILKISGGRYTSYTWNWEKET